MRQRVSAGTSRPGREHLGHQPVRGQRGDQLAVDRAGLRRHGRWARGRPARGSRCARAGRDGQRSGARRSRSRDDRDPDELHQRARVEQLGHADDGHGRVSRAEVGAPDAPRARASRPGTRRRSVTKTCSDTRSSGCPPAACSAATRFRAARSNCSTIVGPDDAPSGAWAVWPPRWTVRPGAAITACAYPTGAGRSGAVTISCSVLAHRPSHTGARPSVQARWYSAWSWLPMSSAWVIASISSEPPRPMSSSRVSSTLVVEYASAGPSARRRASVARPR